ncbi:hypothetical protein BP6252_13127 [Coleophoma cylindrospora]|uniref:Uncharacterized protein n=1 Tax=Coleophoma cylindrospora TaxID=1849047 RepID=A0A3D8QA56_9HELO|nr:hypothetical protein BP6252_13127 [Coleophoma cylindrospora]
MASTNTSQNGERDKTSAMMQDYLYSEAIISERISMGGSAGASQATRKNVTETSKKKASRAVRDFDANWERAAKK